MSALCGRAACGVRCCRGPAGGAAESRPGGARTRTRRPPPGPAPDRGARRRFRPPRPLDSAAHKEEESRPERPQLQRRRGPRQSPDLPSPGAPGPCGAWGQRCAAGALRRGSREKAAPGSTAGSGADSRPGRSRFEEVRQRGRHLGVRTRALHQHTRTHGSTVPTPRPAPGAGTRAHRATRTEAETCHPAGISFNKGKSAKGK